MTGWRALLSPRLPVLISHPETQIICYIVVLKVLKLSDSNPEVKQVWYADDGTGAGKIVHLRPFWDSLCQLGPGYGYFPKASKSVLILILSALLYNK